MLDITRNTGRNKGCLSVVPVRRGGRRPLMFDVACNMARNICSLDRNMLSAFALGTLTSDSPTFAFGTLTADSLPILSGTAIRVP
jgi:hypothetical protein